MRHILIVLAIMTASTAAASDPTGLWRTEADEAGRYLEVRIFPCFKVPEKFCGRIAAARDPRGRILPYEHRGKRMIAFMEPDGLNRWDGGHIWHPIHSGNYPGKLELRGDTLRVSGCALGGLICETQGWRRIE